MISNYNVIYTSPDCKIKEGDIFYAPKISSWRIKRFNGLTVQKVDYAFGCRLHFDWNDWQNNECIEK